MTGIAITNFGEKQLTKLFNDEFLEILGPKMRRIPPSLSMVKGLERKLGLSQAHPYLALL
jgi:hypothetical protein